ncbi:MAG TPA: histidine phosphatase family protein [Saprospiraceae bacterium]|nr:histidine phosphatase family protein [Saprospiraceae bacterium]
MEVKDVCFVRHAKSAWDQPGVDDFDRRLDARGLHDAPMMAAKMHDLGLVPDLIITSGANRARSTAEFFRKEFKLPESRFLIKNEIYEATAQQVYDVLSAAPDDAQFVYIFGHNPTFTWIANHLSGVHIDNVPTCGIVHAQALISSWKKFKPEHAGFIGFHYPKQFA